jgi:hypothetical protein
MLTVPRRSLTTMRPRRARAPTPRAPGRVRPGSSRQTASCPHASGLAKRRATSVRRRRFIFGLVRSPERLVPRAAWRHRENGTGDEGKLPRPPLDAPHRSSFRRPQRQMLRPTRWPVKATSPAPHPSAAIPCLGHSRTRRELRPSCTTGCSRTVLARRLLGLPSDELINIEDVRQDDVPDDHERDQTEGNDHASESVTGADCRPHDHRRGQADRKPDCRVLHVAKHEVTLAPGTALIRPPPGSPRVLHGS